jgi:hypothetical protein
MNAQAKPFLQIQSPAPAIVYEIIDYKEFAKRLALPPTWIMEQTRSRAVTPIPHLRFGRYVRFQWGSPELTKWMHDRHVGDGK